jgi:Carboxypeptidase regulatory-like domain
MMPFRAACIAALLGGLLTAGLPEQPKVQDTNTRNLQGAVTNASGHPAGNAVVQLKNTKTLQIRSFITKDDGNYHFMGLSVDVEYQVKAERDGVATSWKTLSVFNSKRTAVINLKLKK